jgi:hemoglobin
MTSSAPSLYKRLGGIYAIAGAVDILVDRLFANVAVNANEAVHVHHGNPANAAGYKFLVTAWSVEAAGGPKCYVGRDMEKAHEALHIDDKGFDAVAMEIAATLSVLGVPEAEHKEFMDIIESYRDEVVVAPAAAASPA